MEICLFSLRACKQEFCGQLLKDYLKKRVEGLELTDMGGAFFSVKSLTSF
jgi:hypothetical protein